MPGTPRSRREFIQWLAGTGAVVGTGCHNALLGPAGGGEAVVRAAASRNGERTDSHIGNLYPFVQKQADRSPLELSFLRPEFTDLASWQAEARARVFQHLFYAPPPVQPEPEVIRRTDRGAYIEEVLTFKTTPDLRVPARLLIPKDAETPAPAVVVLHCHGGFYIWGVEKVVEVDDEHPVLTEFKASLYEGANIASELARRGYVVITIDAFYWGQRRMLLDDDPPEFRDRRSMSREHVAAFNRRSQQGEQLVARSLLTAGITWPGIMLWDDIRTVDYLASRPEVDSSRLACVGLSMGGYRSFLLAALDERIKAAVDVGWMTSYASQIERHVVNTVGFTFHIVGLYRYMDLPDLAALIAPRAVMVMNGFRDTLFNQDGVQAAFRKIEACYAKAGAPEGQRTRLFDVPHVFNREMQNEAWQWLERWV